MIEREGHVQKGGRSRAGKQAPAWDRVKGACLARGAELSASLGEIAAVLAGSSRETPALRAWCDELEVWLDSLEWAGGRCHPRATSGELEWHADSAAVAEALARMAELGGAVRRFAQLEAVRRGSVARLDDIAVALRSLALDLDDALAAFAHGNALTAGRVVARCVEHGRQFDRETAFLLRALPDTWWETLPGMEASTLGEIVDAVDDCAHGVRRLVDALVVAVLLVRHAAQLESASRLEGGAVAQMT